MATEWDNIKGATVLLAEGNRELVYLTELSAFLHTTIAHGLKPMWIFTDKPYINDSFACWAEAVLFGRYARYKNFYYRENDKCWFIAWEDFGHGETVIMEMDGKRNDDAEIVTWLASKKLSKYFKQILKLPRSDYLKDLVNESFISRGVISEDMEIIPLLLERMNKNIRLPCVVFKKYEQESIDTSFLTDMYRTPFSEVALRGYLHIDEGYESPCVIEKLNDLNEQYRNLTYILTLNKPYEISIRDKLGYLQKTSPRWVGDRIDLRKLCASGLFKDAEILHSDNRNTLAYIENQGVFLYDSEAENIIETTAWGEEVNMMKTFIEYEYVPENLQSKSAMRWNRLNEPTWEEDINAYLKNVHNCDYDLLSYLRKKRNKNENT
ncbi:MAG: hypothetical protein LBC75_11695 [Fibromonadaceae bacterium]|nr:hypothetical protein [Fibromonadaceae bacterium]